MIALMTAATDMEMQAFLDAKGDQEDIYSLVTGIGPVETTLSLAGILHKQPEIDWVLNFGIAGAYLENDTPLQASLLELCLAEQEVLGDLGIQLADTMERFGGDLPVRDRFVLDSGLLSAAGQILEHEDISYKLGTFVTVNCASGTLHRGNQLGRQFRGLCENMEGAAVARVCEEFSLPCLEVRCISNMVEDRNRENWRIQEACAKVGRAAAVLAAGLVSGRF
ncbi:MAG: futalosine hydrolase [Candidatus Electrothrix sp. GW3-4]|uniref:futalosine hydrolase n=1 Tax=Candidatus Electrothrix sp. GW3-4 TaxID=3126740 RepID=UPI0030D0C277